MKLALYHVGRYEYAPPPKHSLALHLYRFVGNLVQDHSFIIIMFRSADAKVLERKILYCCCVNVCLGILEVVVHLGDEGLEGVLHVAVV